MHLNRIATTFLILVLILFTAPPSFLRAADQTCAVSDWQTIDPSPTSSDIKQILWADSQFVASTGSSILMSADGVQWVASTTVLDHGLNDLSWSGSRFVGVSQNYGVWPPQALAIVSSDGQNWTTIDTGFMGPLAAVAWNGARFVAVGSDWGPNAPTTNAMGMVLTSADGETWVNAGVGFSPLADITWGGASFVAVGEIGTIISSPDGVSWEQHPVWGVNEKLTTVIWDGNRFVIPLSSGDILTSEDGADWHHETFASGNAISDIVSNGSEYVAVTAYDPNNINPAGTPYGSILSSPNGRTWTTTNPGAPAVTMNGIAWDGAQFIGVGNGGAILRRCLAPTARPPIAGGGSIDTREGVPRSGVLDAADWQGRPLTFIITEGPTYGTAVIDDPATGAFTYSPTATISESGGSDRFTFRVNNGTVDSDAAGVDVTISPYNTPPVISDIAATTIPGNSPSQPLPFSISDSETAANDLFVTVSSSNNALVPDGCITVGGAGTDRTLTITPVQGQGGASTITVTVSDGDLSNNDSFLLTVENEGVVSHLPPAVVAPRLASTWDFSAVLKTDGTVWTWGLNNVGQLGNGTTENANIPGQVSNLEKVTHMATGASHGIAVQFDGSVWTWGWNQFGQLGEGSTESKTIPVQVAGLAGVTAVAGGNAHSMALKADGTVWTWGWNLFGQLGDGTQVDRHAPVQAGGLTDVVAIAAGDAHCLALKADGTVWAWGGNDSGQLGIGSHENRSTPTLVPLLQDVVEISAGTSHSVARKSDGTLWAWGANGYGQLGDSLYNDDLSDKTSPTAVFNFTGAVAISAGHTHTLAMRNDGTVWAWGSNASCEHGNDCSYAWTKIPQRATQFTGVRQIVASHYYSFSLNTDGTVSAIGANTNGWLGDGSNTDRSTLVTVVTPGGEGPFNVNHLTPPKAAASQRHTLSLKADGTVWAWGDNANGQLGDGTVISRPLPGQVQNLSGIVDVAAGDNHSLALRSDGTVFAWGQNLFGVLGDGTETNRVAPAAIAGLSDIIAVSSKWYHNLALKSDGTVWAWGQNAYGRLGDGSFMVRKTPVQVYGLNNVIAIAAGDLHSLALRSDGTVWAWGYNEDGQVGAGYDNWQGIVTPVQVAGIGDVVAIAAGSFHSLAVKADGTVWAWGLGYTRTPAAIAGISNAVAVAAAQDPSVALAADNTVWIWGGSYGASPLQVGARNDYAFVTAGRYHYAGVLEDGTMLTWGTNDYGQLGDGTQVDHQATPVSVLDADGQSAYGAYRHQNYPPLAFNSEITTTEEAPVDGMLPASDADGDTLVYTIAENGTRGTAVVLDQATGAFRYTPDAGTVGTDAITFYADDGTCVSGTAVVAVSIADNKPPTVTASLPDGAYNFMQQVSLLCSDTSGCAKIFFTTDGSTPTTASDIYASPITVYTTTTLRYMAVDTVGNVSAEKQSQYIIEDVSPEVIITAPVDGETINELPIIQGTASDADSGVASVWLQITDGDYYLNADMQLVDQPVWVPAQGTDDWTLNVSQANLTSGKTYTVSAKVSDRAGNMGATAVNVTFFSGDPAYTQLAVELSSRTILQDVDIELSGKLTRLPSTDMDLSGLDITVTLTAPDGAATARTVTTYDPFGHFEILDLSGFSQKGQYIVEAAFAGTMMLAGSHSAETVLVGASAGYAIIVEGRIDSEEGLASHNKSTNRIYQSLRERGFREEDITYFNYDINQAGFNISGVPEKAAIRSAIDTWARQKMNSVPAPLYLIMVDHGNTDTFYIGPDTITASDLDAWLTDLEGGLNEPAVQEPRIVILGACYSGSFVPRLSASGRIIVTSAAENEESYKGPLEPDNVRVGEFFIEALFRELKNGYSLKDAFRYATDKTETYTRKGGADTNSVNRFFDQAMQHPLLDDNGDGTGSNDVDEPAGDGRAADNVFLGTGVTNTSDSPAEFKAVVGTLHLAANEDAAQLWASAHDDSRVSSAWIEVRSPSVTLEGQGSTGQLVVQLDKALMTYDTATDRWTRAYANFSVPGSYEVFYFTRDSVTGDLSAMRRSIVYRGRDGNTAPDAFTLTAPADGSEQKTVLLFDWTDAVDPDGDSLTYTLVIAEDSIFQNEIFRIEGLQHSIAKVDETAGLPDLATLYWKVQAVDQYGAITESTAWQFSTDNTNFVQPGWMKGVVFDAHTGVPIPGAMITIDGVTQIETAAAGYYLGFLPAGSYSATVSANGYHPAPQISIEITSAGSVVQNFSLTSEAGDIDGSGNTDMADAIIALRCTAGESMAAPIRADYASSYADIGGDGQIGLAEVLYVLRLLSGVK